MNLETAKILRRDMGPYGFEGISSYAEARIAAVHAAMESCKPDEVLKLQGSIEELRKLLKLKDYVSNFLDNK